MPPALSLVIPAYNERARLSVALGPALSWLDANAPGTEVIVVDDGCTDGTMEVVPASVTAVRLPTNRGKGAAVRAGVLASGGARVLISDADFSTPIEDLYRLTAALDGGADIAIGSRGLPGAEIGRRQSPWRQRLGETFNRLVRASVLPDFADTQCGFKLFEGEAARRLFAQGTVDGFAFDVEILALARREGLRVAEVPIRWDNHPDTRVGVLSDAPRMLVDLVRIRRRL